jgi:hypothetical protein
MMPAFASSAPGPTIAERVEAAMEDLNAWDAAEREERRRKLRARPDPDWGTLATAIAAERAERQEQALG